MSKSTHPKAVPRVPRATVALPRTAPLQLSRNVTVMFCAVASAALRSGRLIRLAVYVPPPLSC